MDILTNTLDVLMWIVALKAIIIGSSFSFVKFIKYGKKYADWYFLIHPLDQFPSEK